MKKSILCLSLYLLSSLYHIKANAALDNTVAGSNKPTKESVADYICDTYSKIDFGHTEKLNPDVFRKAMNGYLNLKNAGKLNDGKEIITVADFTKSSNEPRLWIIDLKAGKVLLNTYVAHGQGSGDEFATAFSNNNNSHQSSLGFYVTGDTYQGEHGTSLRLNGMDNGFNDAAFNRGIVVHGASYVCKGFIGGNQRLGRSWGCPAVDQNLAPKIINMIQGGTCLFIYYPQQQYLRTAYWMNKNVDHLPGRDIRNDLQPVAATTGQL